MDEDSRISGPVSAGVNKRVTLTITAVSSFVMAFLVTGTNIALPTIGREFAMEAVLLGWVATSYILTAAAFFVPIGRLADIYGRKKIYTYGLILLTLSSFLCAISNSAIWLISFRVLQGIGGSMIVGPAVAILTSVFPVEERGRALGINTGSTSLGLTTGPFLGGVMTQHLSWRSIFFIVAFLLLLLAVIVLWKLKGEWSGSRGERFDITGSISFSLSIIALMYGFSTLPEIRGIVFVLVGIMGILGFFRWETKAASPVFDISLFRGNNVFIFSNLSVLIIYTATISVSFLLSLYLQYIKGLPPQTAGLVLITTSVVLAICSPISGRLSDRIEPRKIASVGMMLSCVGLSLLIFLNEEIPLGFIIVSLALFGFGMGLFASPNTNAIMSSVEKKLLGTASGSIATMRASGQMLGMGIVMILFSIYIGKTEITPAYYPAFLSSVKVAFMTFTALCFSGIFVQLASRKPPS